MHKLTCDEVGTDGSACGDFLLVSPIDSFDTDATVEQRAIRAAPASGGVAARIRCDCASCAVRARSGIGGTVGSKRVRGFWKHGVRAMDEQVRKSLVLFSG